LLFDSFNTLVFRLGLLGFIIKQLFYRRGDTTPILSGMGALSPPFLSASPSPTFSVLHRRVHP
jgi:hypothetical protein